jgi:pseudouridine-5'-phosphate glycosidase
MGLAETDIKVQAEPAATKVSARDISVTVANGGV